jgi:hypothetical protein
MVSGRLCHAPFFQMSSLTSQPVVVFVRDLMFAGRIGATARAAGKQIVMLRDPQQLADHRSHRLIVDLNQPGALDAAVVWKTQHGGEVVGFVSHVDAETIQKARAAGIDHILSRREFSADVERWLG